MCWSGFGFWGFRCPKWVLLGWFGVVSFVFIVHEVGLEKAQCRGETEREGETRGSFKCRRGCGVGFDLVFWRKQGRGLWIVGTRKVDLRYWVIFVVMEDPLLPTGSGLRRRGESSSSGGFESTGLNNVIVGRRGDAITRGDKYQKAAAMVDQVLKRDSSLSQMEAARIASFVLRFCSWSNHFNFVHFTSLTGLCRSQCAILSDFNLE